MKKIYKCNCGNTIDKDKTYCSPECKRLAWLKRRKGEILPCNYCKTRIYRMPYEISTLENRFCNRECFSKWKSETWQGESSPNFKGLSGPATCSHCNKQFIAKTRQNFCSVQCSNNHKSKKSEVKCQQCDKTFTLRPSEVRNRNFCSKNCDMKFKRKENHPRWISDRSKVKDKNRSERETPEIKNWRKNVFLRDNFTCLNCKARSSSGTKVELHAHHIRKFSLYVDLRSILNNGITLCDACHKCTFKKEEQLISFMENLLKQHEPQTH